jgi:hypothetical protein
LHDAVTIVAANQSAAPAGAGDVAGAADVAALEAEPADADGTGNDDQAEESGRVRSGATRTVVR